MKLILATLFTAVLLLPTMAQNLFADEAPVVAPNCSTQPPTRISAADFIKQADGSLVVIQPRYELAGVKYELGIDLTVLFYAEERGTERMKNVAQGICALLGLKYQRAHLGKNELDHVEITSNGNFVGIVEGITYANYNTAKPVISSVTCR